MKNRAKIAETVLRAIDDAIEKQQSKEHRWHLGASLIGRDCARELWYGFRWAKAPRHQARILRLFDRGHREEERIVKWLRDAGITVYDRDPATGDQYRVSSCEGHFGGSEDAELLNVPLFAESDRILAEFKTHGEKSFALVQAKGVRAAKPEHYTQMCTYMRQRRLCGALYFAINKNDDEIYVEFISADDEHADAAEQRAASIIATDQPPLRIAESPTFYKCKMCTFMQMCHGKEVPAVNCRTCAHAAPGTNGTWKCVRHGHVFTKEAEEVDRENIHAEFNGPRMHDGCSDHVFNPYMLNGVEFVGGNEAENYAELRLASGEIIRNGPNHTPSAMLCLSSPAITSKKR